MPILDYTTEVSVHRSLGDIQGLLARAGARAVSVEYDAHGQPDAVAFRIRTAAGERAFALPARTGGVLAALERAADERNASGKRKLPLNRVTPEHAQRVAWRILRDWVEAQVALIQIGMVDLDEVMLPYQLVDEGKTVYQMYQETQARLAAPGRD